MLKNLDTFFTAVVIFVILAVVIPLLFVFSVVFIGKGPDIDIKVVEPGSSQDLSYQEKLEQAYNKGDQGINPNLNTTQSQSNKQYSVELSDGVVSNPLLSIKQGDTVVFLNTSRKPVKVVGTNWGSGEYIPQNRNYAQTFSVKGTFEYTVVGLNAVYGKIEVK